jgi:hypothetical protein
VFFFNEIIFRLLGLQVGCKAGSALPPKKTGGGAWSIYAPERGLCGLRAGGATEPDKQVQKTKAASYTPVTLPRVKWTRIQENPMIKMLAMAGLAALVTACAAPIPDTAGGPNDPNRPARGSTARGEATAADLGFHGPVYRGNKTDGPN